MTEPKFEVYKILLESSGSDW